METSVTIEKTTSLDSLTRRFLPWWFTIIFLMSVTTSISHYLEAHGWTIEEWLINYQGGFVRRGLQGEIFYQAALLANIDPGMFVVAVHVICYFIFFLVSYKLLILQERMDKYLVLILSPFLFTFQIHDPHGGFRKEILFIAYYTFCTWFSIQYPRHFTRYFSLFVLFYLPFVLCHEMAIFYYPYLFILYAGHSQSQIRWHDILISLSSLLVIPIFHFYTPTEGVIQNIYASLRPFGYHEFSPTAAIGWLMVSLPEGIHGIACSVVNNPGKILHTFLCILFAGVAFKPVWPHLQQLFSVQPNRKLYLFCLAGTLPLFVSGFDWGRYVYIHLVCTFLLTFLVPAQKSETTLLQQYALERRPRMAIAILVCYCLFWNIPHNGSSSVVSSWRFINYVQYARPYLKETYRFYLERMNSCRNPK